MHRTLCGGTTLYQSGLGCDGNKGVLCIPQCFSITEASSFEYFGEYPEPSLGKSNFSLEIQPMYSTTQVTKPDTLCGSLTPVLRCSRCILYSRASGLQGSRWGSRICRDAVYIFYKTSQQGQEGVLSLCRDIVCVFYSPSRLGHSKLGKIQNRKSKLLRNVKSGYFEHTWIKETSKCEKQENFWKLISIAVILSKTVPLVRYSRLILKNTREEQKKEIDDYDLHPWDDSNNKRMQEAITKEYKNRRVWLEKMIGWELGKRLKFDHTKKWYMHKLESFLENETHKILGILRYNQITECLPYDPT